MFSYAISTAGTEKIACGAQNWSKTSNLGDFDQDLKINDYAPLVIDNLGTRGGIVVINSTDVLPQDFFVGILEYLKSGCWRPTRIWTHLFIIL